MLLKSPDRTSFYNNSVYGGQNSDIEVGSQSRHQEQNNDYIDSPDKIGASGEMTDT